MKKIILALFILALASSAFGANTKITELDADTAPTSDDLVVTVNDPDGTPGNRKVAIGNIGKALGTATFGAGSGITWTFDAGAVDPVLTFGSAAVTLKYGDFNVQTGSGIIGANRFSADDGGPALYLRKSRGATVGSSYDIVLNNDILGYNVFQGSNGTGFSSAAYIFAAVDGTPGASADMPGRLVFSTSADGSAAPTERIRIDSAGNIKIAGTAARATTAGTNAIHIFNGTAPVGTLANGCSVYSTSGELYAMDAAGNATLQTPHDRATNEWIFKSVFTPTGKVLHIEVERMLRDLDRMLGGGYIHEYEINQ